MIRDEVSQFQNEFEEFIRLFFDETAEKDQVFEIMTKAYDAFLEGKDLKGLSRKDLMLAAADVLLETTNNMKEEFIVYSDESDAVE